MEFFGVDIGSENLSVWLVSFVGAVSIAFIISYRSVWLSFYGRSNRLTAKCLEVYHTEVKEARGS